MNYYDILLAKKLEDDRDPRVEGLSVTENGRYEEDGVVYKPVIVSVSPPEDSYQLKSITTPTSLATFEASAMPMPSLKVSVEAKQEGSGTPSPENVRPISGWSEVVVTDTGKNLCSTNTIESVAWATENTCMLNLINSLKDGTYSVSFKSTLETLNSGMEDEVWATGFIFTNSSSSNFSFMISTPAPHPTGTVIANSGSFTINSNNRGKFTHIYVYGAGNNIAGIIGTATLSEIQIERGSTATTYEPYNGTTTTISLPQTVYGGEVDVVNGTSGNKNALGYVDLGTLNWSNPTTGIFNVAIPDMNTEIKNKIMCSIYPLATNSFNWASVASYSDQSISTAGNNYIYVKDSRYSSVADFKTAMNGVQLVYELATPTTFTTQPTPIKSLEGTNNLSVDCGEVIEGEYFIAL